MFITMLVVHMFLNKKFILASNSSSRYRLLKNAGLNFTQTNPVCDEDHIKKELIKKKTKTTNLPKILAKEKALSISKLKPNKLVVGADTVILFKNKIINKATNIVEAKKKLKRLSGNNHQIISCVSICYKEKQIWSKQQTSTIIMKKLNNEQINDYLKFAGKNILRSVGCYEAEKFGPQIIKSIKGDFFNVLGFPLFPFLSYLKNA
jgi:septum formation protein